MTAHLLSLGSIVQNGKFSAGAALLVKTLKNVDFLQKLENNSMNFYFQYIYRRKARQINDLSIYGSQRYMCV